MIARALAALLVLGAPASAETPWITRDDYDALHIVVHGAEETPDATAARRLRVRWERVTGYEPTMSSEPEAGAVNVWIGVAARERFPDAVPESLTADSFVIRTRRDASGAHLVLAGGGAPGTLYAEWAFLERYMGAKSLGAAGFVWPEAPPESIPTIDCTWTPPFEYRDSNFGVFLDAPWVTSVNQLNGQWTALPEALGGHIGFVHDMKGYGHTFHDFVAPDEYFESHPEYFAEIDGERVRESQLCLTNPDVLRITIERAREFLRAAAPNERILSISQMDYLGFASWCTCDACRAVDDEEGSQSGTIVRFVNVVAEALEGEFPDGLFETFAYMYSRKPPKYARPRDNVLVRVCSIEADFGRRLGDRRSPENGAFVRDLKQWRRIARNVWVWDYTQNWWAFEAPHPNEHVLQANLALFERIGVDGVFEQASPYASNADMEALKGYLVGRGLREPRFDWKRATEDFLDEYYGPAAPIIDEYRQLLRRRVRAFDGPMDFYNDLDWIDADTVEEGARILERARQVATEPPYAERVGDAILGLEFAALVCPPRVYQEPGAYVFTRPASPSLAEHVAALESRGVRYLNDYPLGLLVDRMDGETPPRYERAPIETLCAGDDELWMVPARSGAVVRWREVDTRRDWLRGFDDVWNSAGRLQDWADTGPHPTAWLHPVDERYEVVERGEGALTLRSRLDNDLWVERRMAFDDDGLGIRVRLENAGTSPVVTKFGVGMRLDESGVLKPRISQDDGRIEVRYADVQRSFVIDDFHGDVGERTVERDSRADTTDVLVEVNRAELAPGASREFGFRVRLARGSGR